jgi:ferredoxin-type protein NapH
MKSTKILGLALFLAGFLLFNLLFFLGDFKLTDEIVSQQIQDPKKAGLFLQSGDDLTVDTISSSISFVEKMKQKFEAVNKTQLGIYGVSDNELRMITNAGKKGFRIAVVDSVIAGEDEVSSFKRKAFRDYGSWLEGRVMAPGELEGNLNGVAANIREYAIIGPYGFDRYVSKDLLFSLTKASSLSPVRSYPLSYLFLSFGLCVIGALFYILPRARSLPGIRNNGIFFSAMKNTGWLGIMTGTWLIAFYIVLYFYPEYMTGWVLLVDPVSELINGHEAGRFFLYGFMYTLCILVMGVRMMMQYRHSNYHLVRTVSVMFFQTAFAFLIPEILVRLNRPYFDFKNIWPLDYSFFFDSRIETLLSSGALGLFMIFWGIVLIIIGVPVLVYLYGKRWYCSWVCGCGGLAETFGDPYRQLSNKSVKAWRVERWLVHGVLVLVTVMTVGVLYTYFTGNSWFLFFDSYKLRELYGAVIGAGFAGVVGTGFYPLMGNRVWCRFGCPLAAYLGLVQRFKSRFRITTNGGQCISCGNCSTYCEMGIDVRWYAQRGQNIVRSSCVGCGVCSSVCPRGVLNLEVKDEKGRFGQAILVGNNGIKVVE